MEIHTGNPPGVQASGLSLLGLPMSLLDKRHPRSLILYPSFFLFFWIHKPWKLIQMHRPRSKK